MIPVSLSCNFVTFTSGDRGIKDGLSSALSFCSCDEGISSFGTSSCKIKQTTNAVRSLHLMFYWLCDCNVSSK